MMRARMTNSAVLYVSPVGSTRTRFRVLTPDLHAIATTIEPTLAAATALAVARHHRRHYATIAGSDGRWLDVHLDGRCELATDRVTSQSGWPAEVQERINLLLIR
jgi:hypothetical protein